MPLAATLPALAGCASAGASGPSAGHVAEASRQYVEASGIKVIKVTDTVARQVSDAAKPVLFSQELGQGYAEPTTIGPGDVVDITIVEAPAVLFSNTANSALTAAGAVRPNTVSSGLELPQQMVTSMGVSAFRSRVLSKLLAARAGGWTRYRQSPRVRRTTHRSWWRVNKCDSNGHRIRRRWPGGRIPLSAKGASA